MERKTWTRSRLYLLFGIITLTIYLYNIKQNSSRTLNTRRTNQDHRLSNTHQSFPPANIHSTAIEQSLNAVNLKRVHSVANIHIVQPENTSNHLTTSVVPHQANNSSAGYVLKQGFTLPHPLSYKSVQEIVNQRWYKDLQVNVNLKSKSFVYLVSSNSAYMEVLLNWLLSAVTQAGVQIETILVISYDEGVSTVLSERQIPTIYVPFNEILSENVVLKASEFTKVMMSRLAVFRLLNHWGVDVVNLDTDAILLRDPEPLFNSYNDSEVVGMQGRFPPELIQEWGATICAGTVLIRSSPKTEDLWNKIQETKPQSFSDQQRLNYGLKRLGIHWNPIDDNSSSPGEGVCADNGLKVTLLPQAQACRTKACKPTKKGSYYIWHDGGAKSSGSKKLTAKKGGAWFLTKDWKEKCTSNDLKGYRWLICIASRS